MDDKLLVSRSGFEALGTQYAKAEDVIIEKEIIRTISCYWVFEKEKKPANRIIIYLHGGCFILGSIYSHQAMVSHVSKALATPILFIEYSLAPENPFPCAINDILEIYQDILLNKQITDIVFMGDSAGAGLAVSVISRLNKANINQPSHLVMLSPWIDLSCSSHSITANAATDPILTKEELETDTSLYLGSSKLSDANPIETMFGDFPPTLILVGSGEILLDDSKLIYEKITEKQPETKLSIYDKQTHVWLLDDIYSASSKNAIEEINNFINK